MPYIKLSVLNDDDGKLTSDLFRVLNSCDRFLRSYLKHHTDRNTNEHE